MRFFFVGMWAGISVSSKICSRMHDIICLINHTRYRRLFRNFFSIFLWINDDNEEKIFWIPHVKRDQKSCTTLCRYFRPIHSCVRHYSLYVSVCLLLFVSCILIYRNVWRELAVGWNNFYNRLIAINLLWTVLKLESLAMAASWKSRLHCTLERA